MATVAIIEFDLAAGEKEIAAAWRDFKETDDAHTWKGLELGRVLYEWRDKWKSKGGYGSKGKGLAGYLQVLNIPKGTSDYWIKEHEYNVGLKQRPGICTTCECGEEFPSRSQYKRHRREEHPAPHAAPAYANEESKEYKHTYKNPAIRQLAVLRKHFPGENIQIQRVGKSEMTDFEVWIKDVPASKVQGRGTVNVMMTFDQLRRVKGNVQVGARGSFAKAKRFLNLNA